MNIAGAGLFTKTRRSPPLWRGSAKSDSRTAYKGMDTEGIFKRMASDMENRATILLQKIWPLLQIFSASSLYGVR